MTFKGETEEYINKCPRCGNSSWQWERLNYEFIAGDGGYIEYRCPCCGLYIYENYAWSHTDWTDD